MKLKRIVFKIILFFIPLVAVFLIELILMTFDYGEDISFVSTVEKNGKTYYTINQLVGARYFEKNRLYYRKSEHDFFEANKSYNTLRVFCFGASTTAGFPYEYNAIPTEFLRQRLVSAFPTNNIEIINTAIAATNSFTVVEFEKEMVKYKPDLFIIYMGQNEFYGAYGAASTISIGKTRWLIKLNLWLQNFRTYYLVKNITHSILNLFITNQSDEEIKENDDTLMEYMIKSGAIRYNDKDYISAKENFIKNYTEAIEIAKENNIPIIISTLVTNEKDLSPFVSLPPPPYKTFEKKDQDIFNLNYNKALELKRNGDFKNAINYFNKSNSVDSTYANAHYEIAKCYYELGDYKNSKQHFLYANDYDGLRFRAPSEYNTIIRNLSYSYNVPLSDVYNLFSQNSPNGIIGNELIIDHLHPNVRGYFLMAKSWFDTIIQRNVFKVKPKILSNPDSTFWYNAPITSLDSTIGKLKILELKNKPPFKKHGSKFSFTPKNIVEQTAYNLTIKHTISWGQAHLNLANEYLQKNEYEKAIREFKAILSIDENIPNILIDLANVYFEIKDFHNSEKYYIKANSMIDDNRLKYKLGLVELKLNKLSLAIDLLQESISDYSNNELSSAELLDAKYQLALAYHKINQNEISIEILKDLLKNNPKYSSALSLLEEIKKR